MKEILNYSVNVTVWQAWVIVLLASIVLAYKAAKRQLEYPIHDKLLTSFLYYLIAYFMLSPIIVFCYWLAWMICFNS